MPVATRVATVALALLLIAASCGPPGKDAGQRWPVDDRKDVAWIAVEGYVLSVRDEPRLIPDFLDLVAAPIQRPETYRVGRWLLRGHPVLVGFSDGRVWARDGMVWWMGGLSEPLKAWLRRAEGKYGPTGTLHVMWHQTLPSQSMRLLARDWQVVSVYRPDGDRWSTPHLGDRDVGVTVKDMLGHLPNYCLGLPAAAPPPPVTPRGGSAIGAMIRLPSPIVVPAGRLDWGRYYGKDGFCMDTTIAVTTRMTPIRCRSIALLRSRSENQRRDEAYFRDDATGLWWPGAIAGYPAGRSYHEIPPPPGGRHHKAQGRS
jgi:hypothetical protein